jgi:COP9 signalosome complex subunit 5
MDSVYSHPDELIATIRQQKPWCQDPKYFKKVKINPSAAIKMLTHGQQGVDKGIGKSGTPIEVMGLLLGRPDHEDPHSYVISDAMPLPIEGFETRVVADDENVINYMIELGECLETTRKEKICGWYHTHPFDLDGTNHCFLSNTDITTQLHWQRSEDPHGNPWLAIVIDPLLSLHTNKPQLQAFRVYPPDYSPPANETPDGKIVKNDAQRIALWGVCWNRYYALSVEYYMSNLSKDILEKLKNRFMWSQAFIASKYTKQPLVSCC